MKGCKNCPAYAKCTAIYRGSACDALRSTYGIDSDPEIMTNADRIRAMSDEELVAFMMADLPCDALYGQMCTIYHGNCEGCVRDWLQQPAEEKTL